MAAPAPPPAPPYLYLVSRPMNCTMQRRVITAGRDRQRGGRGGTQGYSRVAGVTDTRHRAHAPAVVGVWGAPTVKGVGDERGGRASDHLSGGLGEKWAVRRRGRGGQVTGTQQVETPMAPVLY